MKFYENKNNNIKSKFFKGNNRIKSYRIKSFFPIKYEKPVFDIGETVSFRYFYQNEEGIIDSYKYKKDGQIEYVVRIKNMWSLKNTKHIFQSYDLYIKPLTRKVLFEKSLLYKKQYEVKISYSGSSIMNYWIVSKIITPA